MQQQSAANKASGISTGSRDALLRDLGAAYLSLKKGDGSQEAVDAALAAVEAQDSQFASMGSLDDLDTAAGSAPSAPPDAPRARARQTVRRPLRLGQFHARRHVGVARPSRRMPPGNFRYSPICCTECTPMRADETTVR